jgi:hypothetical protein
MDLDFYNRFKKSIEEIELAGNGYADARAKSYYLQEMSKVILSKIQKSLGEIPVGRAEIQARASEDYEKHVFETSEAIKQEHIWKNKLEVAKAKFEGNRSLCSMEKRIIDKTD